MSNSKNRPKSIQKNTINVLLSHLQFLEAKDNLQKCLDVAITQDNNFAKLWQQYQQK